MIDPRVLDLNIDFLLDREVAPVGIDGDRLSLGMRDPRDIEPIAALRFATGLKVDPVALDECAWSEWREALTAARPDAAGPTHRMGVITIRLGVDNVNAAIAPDYADTFAAIDRDAWSRLAARAGTGARIAVIVQRDAAFEIELGPAEDARDIGSALACRSPLPVAAIVWSSPFTQDAASRISLVRAQWLEQRITTIGHALAPAALTVTDEAGRPFAVPISRNQARSPTAPVLGMLTLVALVCIAFQRWPLRDIQHRSPDVARVAASPTPAQHQAGRGSAQAAREDQADGFALVGVVGRLPHDAVALVRPPWGRTVTLRVGDSLLGWRLVAVAADRVTLAKGAMRQELVLPAPADQSR